MQPAEVRIDLFDSPSLHGNRFATLGHGTAKVRTFTGNYCTWPSQMGCAQHGHLPFLATAPNFGFIGGFLKWGTPKSSQIFRFKSFS